MIARHEMDNIEETLEIDNSDIQYIDDDIYTNVCEAYFDTVLDIAGEGIDEIGGFRYPLLALHSKNETYQIFRPSENQTEADFLLSISNSKLVDSQRNPALSYLTLRCLPKSLAKNLFPVDRFHYYGAVVICFNISLEGSYLNIFAPVLDDGYNTLHIDGLGLSIDRFHPKCTALFHQSVPVNFM